MDVELHATRVPYAALGVVYLLLAACVLAPSSPMPLKAAAFVAAVVFSVRLYFRTWGRSWSGRDEMVQALRLEPLGRLSVLVGPQVGGQAGGQAGGKPRRLIRVRNFSTPRLLRRYAELLLELDDGRKTTVLVFPGVVGGDAFRRLRKFLLSANAVTVPDKAGRINRLAGELMSFLLRIKRRPERNARAVE